MSNENTEIVKPDIKVVSKESVKYTLTLPERNDRLLSVLGSQEKVNKFVATVINLLVKNPKLQECDAQSFHNCLNKCADFDLMPDGRVATLAPFGGEATFMLMAQGYIELLGRNGILVTVCDWREADDFQEVNGQVRHSRNFIARAKKTAGELIGYVVHASMPDGRIKSEVILMEYIEKCKSKSKNKAMWTTEKAEMEKKTCVRYIAKYLPLTSTLRDLIRDDDKANYDEGIPEQKVARANIGAMFGGASDPDAIDVDGNREDAVGCES